MLTLEMRDELTIHSCPFLMLSFSVVGSELANCLLKVNIFMFGIGFPGKESACNAGDLGSIPSSGRSPGGGHGNSFQYSCLKNPSGQRSLTGYSPWGRKELDMTEGLSTFGINSVQFSSVAQSCLTLCDPMNRSMPGLPAHHQLPEFTQTHVH